MATTQNPVTGRMSGKFANAVFSTQYSQNIMKAKPLSVRNPQSDLQKKQRALMSKAGSIVKTINPFLSKLYANQGLKMPASSYAVKDLLTNCLSAVGEVVSVDSSKLLTINDKHNFAANLTANRSVTDIVSVSWDASVLENLLGSTKKVYGLCYAVSSDTFFLQSNAPTSADETMSFAIPGNNSAKSFVIIFTSESGLTKVDAKKALD